MLTLHILYSGLILVLTCFLFYPHCYSRCGRLLSYSLSKGGCSLLVHIRPYSIFLFFITGYFYFRRVVRNDSLVRRLRRQRSRPCAVGRLGTVERRRTVTVFVKPLLESPLLGRGPGNRYIPLFFSHVQINHTLEICGIARRPMCAYMSV